MDLNDPTLVAILGAEVFERAGIPHALYGGLLVAAYGEPPIAGRALEQAGLRTQMEFQDLTFGGLSVSRLTILGSGAFTALRDLDDAASALRRSRDLIDSVSIDNEIWVLAGEIPDFDVSSRMAAIRTRAQPPPDKGV